MPPSTLELDDDNVWLWEANSRGGRTALYPDDSPSAPVLSGVALCTLTALGAAVALLGAFLLFRAWSRRRTRLAGARAKRGKFGPGTAQVDAEVLDGRRRGFLPWPLGGHDNQRSFVFGIDLSSIWGPRGAGRWGAGGDDSLTEVLWPDGRSSSAGASGPRFLATTASGKALQVVVSTRPLQQYTSASQHSGHGGGERDGGGSRQLVWGFSQGTSAAATPTPLSRLASRASHAGSNPALATSYDGPLDDDTSGFAGLATQQPTASAARAGPPAAGAGEPGSGESGGAGNGAAGAHGGTASEGGTAGPRAAALQRRVSDGGRVAGASSDGFDSEDGAGPALHGADGEGGGTFAAQGAGALGRGAELDPAVAWYSRALHRQVADRLTAAQAAAGVSKAHQA
ncbi:hypothetical protein TSOC_001208 [Tetrabaena socialis]|uniref:Uncharacterized protein n=1 Tax=Tetrabaena socialis TaxID=47790 RepID=A0A2J8AHE6_9CHLO|nr:hypothetical protein TSOC_001208 [Tetrabaena socialis]|eukprot:PNH11921.1 hypothetical protein TSOC_001208 [Tetrabaena socialis]